MARYTLKNLKKEVEDSAKRFGFAPDLEARFAREELELEKSGLTYQRLAPNFRIPFGHRHKEQEEVYVLVSGSGRLKLDEEILELPAMGRGADPEGDDAELRGRSRRRGDDPLRRSESGLRGRGDDARLVEGLEREPP